MVLYCSRFIRIFTQIIHKKQKVKVFLILLYSTLKSTVVQYNSWHTGAGIKWPGKKSYWVEEGEEVGDSRAEGLLAVGDGGQAAISLMPDTDGTDSGSLRDSILSSLLKKWSSDIWIVALFFLIRWHSSIGLHSEWLLRPLQTVIRSGSMPQKLTVSPQIKKIPLSFLASWISLALQLPLPLVSLGAS